MDRKNEPSRILLIRLPFFCVSRNKLRKNSWKM